MKLNKSQLDNIAIKVESYNKAKAELNELILWRNKSALALHKLGYSIAEITKLLDMKHQNVSKLIKLI